MRWKFLPYHTFRPLIKFNSRFFKGCIIINVPSYYLLWEIRFVIQIWETNFLSERSLQLLSKYLTLCLLERLKKLKFFRCLAGVKKLFCIMNSYKFVTIQNSKFLIELIRRFQKFIKKLSLICHGVFALKNYLFYRSLYVWPKFVRGN